MSLSSPRMPAPTRARAAPPAAPPGGGGRVTLDFFEGTKSPEHFAREAARTAILQLGCHRPAPAGEMPVVLGPGWPGVLLHEAVGHGLEADFNRKKTSAFAGLIGQKVASEKVTVVDNGRYAQPPRIDQSSTTRAIQRRRPSSSRTASFPRLPLPTSSPAG